MTKKKSIKKNYIYNLLYEILVLAVPLITTPYISRVLGVDGVGEYSYTNSIAQYFALIAALGTTVYGRREIAYLQDKKYERSKTFFEIETIRIAVTSISVIIYCITVNVLNFGEIGYIQAILIFSVAFDITWFFQGVEDFGRVVLRNTLIKIINIIFIFTFVKTSDDLLIYVFGIVGIPFIGNVVMWQSLRHYIQRVNVKQLKPTIHLKGSIALFVPTIAAQVYLLLDKTMLGLFTDGNKENGYYEQAQKIIKICWTMLTTFSAVVSPRVAYTLAKKELDKTKLYMRKSFSTIWLISIPIVFGIIAISDNLVPWFFGNEFSKVALLLKILAFVIIPIGINGLVGGQYLINVKKNKIYTASILIGAMTNIVLNSILIPKYYAVGASIASIIAEVLIMIVQLYYFVSKVKMFTFIEIIQLARNYIISGIIMFVCILTTSRLLSSNIQNTVILICEGIIIYGGMLFILRDAYVLENIKKIMNKIRKKGDIK